MNKFNFQGLFVMPVVLSGLMLGAAQAQTAIAPSPVLKIGVQAKPDIGKAPALINNGDGSGCDPERDTCEHERGDGGGGGGGGNPTLPTSVNDGKSEPPKNPPIPGNLPSPPPDVKPTPPIVDDGGKAQRQKDCDDYYLPLKEAAKASYQTALQNCTDRSKTEVAGIPIGYIWNSITLGWALASCVSEAERKYNDKHLQLTQFHIACRNGA